MPCPEESATRFSKYFRCRCRLGSMTSESSVAIKEFRVYIMTWNVVCRGPIEDLHSALGLDPPVLPESLPDMYAIGFQEVSARPQCLLRQAFFEEPWIQAVRAVLRKYRYVKIKHVRLQGLVLTVFTKREHLVHLRGCMSTYTRTGLGGVWGNKGSVTVRMVMYGCSMCFVNCHLAAHETELAQRINEYNAIIDKQTFEGAKANNILTHDYAFWFGDLNFRLDGLSMDDIRTAIENGTVQPLLQNDQLSKVRSTGRAFHEFSEKDITFAPTYKCTIDSTGYDFSRRKPAWTDRILYRFRRDTCASIFNVTQHKYDSHDLYLQSDHKPVSGYFTVKVFSQPEHPLVFFFPVTPWTINQDCFAWYYTSPGTEVLSSDWVALYRDNFTSLEDHISYVWASTRPLDSLPSNILPYTKNLPQRQSTTHSTGRSRHFIRTGHSDDEKPSPPSPASPCTATPSTITSPSSPCSTRSPTPSSLMSPSPPEEPSSGRRKSDHASVNWMSEESPGSGTHNIPRGRRESCLKSISEEVAGETTGNSSSPWMQAICGDEAMMVEEGMSDGHNSEPNFYRVLFSSHGLLLVGKYRLLYLRGDTDVLGMSSAFKVKTPLRS
ncbi:inositol polyphosphate 5-phosphatase K-like isoform X2 [Ornithodoros turicata]|uniref:inositol polyphosphate 5-phosphatase K-like isoform X2 n=1 Tax=Ornithodoros turicata TaxID=34597 RepID=UPI003139E6F9